MTKTEITIGDTYRMGSYEGAAHGRVTGWSPSSGGSVVRVTGFSPSGRGWYNDHQDGGWFTTGTVEFQYLDAEQREDNPDGGTVSLEYAADHWDKAAPDAELPARDATLKHRIDRFEMLQFESCVCDNRVMYNALSDQIAELVAERTEIATTQEG